MNKKAALKNIVFIFLILFIIISAAFVISEIVIEISTPNIQVNITIDRGEIVFSHEDIEVGFTPYFRMNNIIYNASQIPETIDIHFWKEQISDNQWKYGIDFYQVPTNIKDNLQNVILHRTRAEGLTLEDVRLEGSSIIIKNKVIFSHDDLLSKYTIPIINITDIVIGNITANFVSNGDGTWNISFDPVLTIKDTGNGLSVMEDIVGENNFSHLNISTTAPYDSLVLYMPFDDNISTTKTYDYTKYSNDGSLGNTTVTTNPVWTGSGYIGGAYTFDGIDDNLSLGNKFDVGGNRTIMAWIKLNNLAQDGRIITKFNITGGLGQWVLWFDDNVSINTSAIDRISYVYLNTSTASEGLWAYSTQITASGAWYHIAVVHNWGVNATIYVNGVEVTEYERNATLTTGTRSNVDVRIGSDTANSVFNGTIDEVMIFNSTLTSSQITDIYNNQSSKFKISGNQTMYTNKVGANDGYDSVNVSVDMQSYFESNISGRIGMINDSLDNLTGLVLYMPFEWNSPKAWDISGMGNDGTLNNGVLFNQSGGLNGSNAYRFDGVDDYVSVASSSSLNFNSTQNYTISMWVNPVNVASMIFFYKWNWCGVAGSRFSITSSNFYYYYKNLTGDDKFTSSTHNLNFNTWNYITISVKDTNFTYYRNGAVSYSATLNKWKDAQNIFYFGNGDGACGLNNFFNGSIDEVRIYNRSLSAAEILTIYQQDTVKFNQVYYTNWQNITNGATNLFNISTEAEYIWPEFQFWAGTNLSYSPILRYNVTLRTSSVTIGTNKWTCTSGNSSFTNADCWSLGRVPVTGDTLIFDAGGVGNCNITNNTMPQNLSSFTVTSGYTGIIYFSPLFAVGNWTGLDTGTQQWNVVSNITILNGTMLVYGDYPYNITDDGHGQEWRSVSGNITIGAGGKLDGVGLGFPGLVGPGAGDASTGGTYGGKGYANTKATYGNETQPLSLGSGGYNRAGSSAIKLQGDYVRIDGSVNMTPLDCVASTWSCGSGGSIWLQGNNISGSGMLESAGGRVTSTVNAFYGGGGGRIALTSSNVIEFSGVINTVGGNSSYLSSHGSGGTVYINATNSVTMNPGNISVVGYNGSRGGSDWGQRINITSAKLILSGTYNASKSGGTYDGQITLNYTDCDSDFNLATFIPNPTYLTGCDVTPPQINFTSPTSSNNSIVNVSWVYVNITSSDTGSNHSVFVDWNRSLVLWMRMDDRNSSGDPWDRSTWSNNGTNIGATYNSSGYIGGAMMFDGNGNYISVPVADNSVLDISGNQITQATWIYPTSNVAFGTIATRNAGYYFQRHSDGKLGAYQYGTSPAGYHYSTGTVPLNQWSFVAYTYNGTYLTFYINGTDSGGVAKTGNIAQLGGSYLTEPFRIGWDSSPGTRYFNGTIDDVMIFSRALSASEIQSLYNATQYQYYNNFTNLADANYTFQAYAQDREGNLNQTELRQIQILTSDTTFPLVSIKYPINQTYNVNVSNLNYTYSDTNPDSCWYSINLGIVNSTSVLAGINFSNVPSIEGSNNYTLFCNDTSNNINSSTIYFFKDTVLPVPSIIYPTNTTYNINISALNYTYSDLNPGSCIYSKNFGVTNSSSVLAGANFTGITSAEGSNNWTVYCNDTSNNLNTTSVYFTKDTTQPALSIIYPTNITYNVNISNLNYTYSDTNPSSCWYSRNLGLTNSTAVTAGINFSNVPSIEGSNNYTLFCNDSINNLNSTIVYFFKDTTNPQIKITSPTNTSYNINISNLNFTVGDTNLQTCIWSRDGWATNTSITCGTNKSNMISVEGTNTYLVWANDTSGNANSSSVTFWKDTVIPLVSFNPGTDTDGAIISRRNIFINVTASDTNIANITLGWNGVNESFAVNDGDFYWENKTSLVDGIYTFSAWINDTSGNWNVTELRTVTIDATSPRIKIVHPVNTSYIYNITGLNYTISDIHLDACWYSLDRGESNNSITCGINITGINSTEGNNTWIVWANDTLNNINISLVNFYVNTSIADNTPPNISILYPVNDSYFQDYSINISLNVSAWDENNISSYWWSYTSSTYNYSFTPNTTISWAQAVDTTIRYTIWVWANDTYNNIASNTTEITIHIPRSGGVTGGPGGGGTSVTSETTPTGPVCGDGICDKKENFVICSKDCPNPMGDIGASIKSCLSTDSEQRASCFLMKPGFLIIIAGIVTIFVIYSVYDKDKKKKRTRYEDRIDEPTTWKQR